MDPPVDESLDRLGRVRSAVDEVPDREEPVTVWPKTGIVEQRLERAEAPVHVVDDEVAADACLEWFSSLAGDSLVLSSFDPGPCVRAERCTVIRPLRRGDSDRSLRHGH